ncbi:MAG: SAM-dependent chlorinase/fluorinase [Gemmatimonadota bacterium]
MPRVTLLTDFGTRDGYVGAMKGVIASIFPGVIIDDVSHSIEAGDIRSTALVLARYWSRYPPGTIHVVVVDPGVGTERRAIAGEVDRRFFVAPDNGVLSRVLDASEKSRIVQVENPEYILPEAGSTFHGRDVFAPAAAYLARGVHLTRLGARVQDPVRLEPERVRKVDGAMEGKVISQDRFGNLVTNLPGSALEGEADVQIGGQTIPVVKTYGEAAPERLAALVNSDGRVEVAVRDGSAARLLGAGVGTPIRITHSAAFEESE